MKKVVLLTTGGTIASKRDEKTGLLVAGALTGEELAAMCELSTGIDVQVESVFQVPSNRMDVEKLIALKNKIEAVLNDEAVAGVVVTHGTDTLEETAYFLDLTLDDARPVIVTGSMRGPEDMGTDAFVNLRNSLIAAASEAMKHTGVTVVFNEKIFSARYVKKVHASNVDGFAAPGYGYIGIIDGDEVIVNQKPLHRETYQIGDHLPVVDIITFYLGADGKFVKASVASGARGIILEGFGRGHVPPKSVRAIEDAVKRGVVAVLTTRAEQGQVKEAYQFPGGVSDLKRRGVILGKDYDSKKARIKLAVLLAAEWDVSDITKAFE